jgi:spore coat protein JB
MAITYRRIFTRGGNFVNLSAFEEEREMMLLVQEADFVVVELTLYTDTHPDDEEALEQWRESIKAAAIIRRQYENRYGPLSLYSIPSEEAIEMGWRWNQAPWPWQR